MARAQIVMEFIIIIAIAVFIGIIFLISSQSLLGDISQQQRVDAINDVGYNIQDEVLLAQTMDDGYSRHFVVPNLANVFPYTITNDNESVTLTSGEVRITYILPPINGNFVQGTNTISKNGNITVGPG